MLTLLLLVCHLLESRDISCSLEIIRSTGAVSLTSIGTKVVMFSFEIVCKAKLDESIPVSESLSLHVIWLRILCSTFKLCDRIAGNFCE